jgi:hypothetical protein
MLKWALIGVLSAGCAVLWIWVRRLVLANAQLEKELGALKEKLEEALQLLAAHDKEPKSKAFKRLVDLLVAAGVPGLILVAAMTISGLAGAAAITTALAMLGGPAGMLGGIGVLILIGVVLTQYSVVDITQAVLRSLLKTRSKADLIEEINSLPRVVPEKLRIGAKSLLEGQ